VLLIVLAIVRTRVPSVVARCSIADAKSPGDGPEVSRSSASSIASSVVSPSRVVCPPMVINIGTTVTR